MTRAFTMRGPCAAQLEIVQPAPVLEADVPASAQDAEPEWYGDPDVATALASLEYEWYRARTRAKSDTLEVEP